MGLTLVDFFCGAGGSSQGAAAVPGVTVRLAANHWDRAIESHAANFPGADHFQGDIHAADVARLPAGSLFWASPECPQWSAARGRRRDFDKQPDLFGEILPDAAADRSRALMWDVPRYLEAASGRGGPVLAGVVENVIEVRRWIWWADWTASIRDLGYRVRLVALNSMHARPARTLAAPQSRDRLYLAYWHRSLGRDPDWDRWLRPSAWCGACGETVAALQAWKRPGIDMGRYRQQYVYRCPHARCRHAVVEPSVLPAAAAIDWSDLGTRIGDRARPMRPATRERIAVGLRRYATAVVVPAGGTWRNAARPVGYPLAARTARENDGLACPPFPIPLCSGRPETVSVGGLATVAAHGSGHVLVPYYRTGVAQPVAQPVGTLSTRDRYALATGSPAIDVNDVLFRMLKPTEVGRAMAFAGNYVVLGTQRERIRQYGNAVTPPVAEVLVSALVEAVTGESIDAPAAGAPAVRQGVPA